MKTLVTTAVAVSFALTAGVAVPANAVTVGPLAVTTSSLSFSTASSCATVPLTWYLVSAPQGVDSWSIDGDIVDAAGASRAWLFEYEQLPVTQAGDSDTICDLAEGVNTFTVAADVDAWTPSFAMYSTRFTATMTITRTTPPPPPPVPPAPPAPAVASAIAFASKPVWFKRAKYARIGALAEVTSTCSEPRAITLSGSNGGGWRPLRTAKGYSSAYLRARVPYKYKRVRLEVAGTAKCLAAISRDVKVPKRPAR